MTEPDNGSQQPRCPDIIRDDRTLLAWQRSHMANERTFLAWCRTSITLLAFGFVVEKFELFLHYLSRTGSHPGQYEVRSEALFLSLFCFALAGIAVVSAGTRFLSTRRHINLGVAEQSILPDVLVILSAAVIVIVATILALPRLMNI